MTVLYGRHFETGQRTIVEAAGSMISRVSTVENHEADTDHWIAPAFWDIQVNGRWGISFSDSKLTVGQVARIVRAQAELGTARLCPTLITAPLDDLRHGLRMIDLACRIFADVEARVVGIHLEGPWISEVDGYRGAHPVESVRDPNWDDFQRLQEASGGRIAIVTLAPERPGAIEFIRRATEAGVVIALGHTSADGEILSRAVDAGARLSTHLGNGIASTLDRHPNPIWDQLADDRLMASVIADGHHLGSNVLRSIVRAKGPERVILVSDASPLAGLSPGRYGEWEVDASGKIVVAGTPYLAGSNQGIEVGINHLIRHAGLTIPQAIHAATTHPARLLGKSEPSIEAGQPADLIRFRVEDGRFVLVDTIVDGLIS